MKKIASILTTIIISISLINSARANSDDISWGVAAGVLVVGGLLIYTSNNFYLQEDADGNITKRYTPEFNYDTETDIFEVKVRLIIDY